MKIDSVNPEAINRLDQFWESLLGNGPATGESDPALAYVVRRLHALDDAPAPDPAFVRRLESRLVDATTQADATTVAPISSSPSPLAPTASRLRPSRRLWKPLEYIAAAVLLLATGFAAYGAWQLAGPSASQSTPAPAPSDIALYVSEADGQCLQRLDPITLQDQSDGAGPCIDLATPTATSTATGALPPTYLASTDGSTVVRVEYPIAESSTSPIFTVTVLDGRTGAIRNRFTHQGFHLGSYGPPLLSGDGSRLLIPNQPAELGGPISWSGFYVYDTTDGRLVSTVHVVQAPEARASLPRFYVDPAGTRLYGIVTGRYSHIPVAGADSPSPPTVTQQATREPFVWKEVLQIVAYDLATGAMVGNLLDLPPMPPPYAETFPYPAVAFSPDGGRMAFVHPDGRALTLVDTAGVAIDRTISLQPVAGTPSSALGPPIGRATPAVNRHGDPYWATFWTEAAFSSDGRTLFHFAWVFSLREGYLLGMQVIDVASGEITATVIVDNNDMSVNMSSGKDGGIWSSPDGESLYIYARSDVASRDPSDPSQPDVWILRRLDADTLAVEAEREFRGYRSVLIWSSDG